MSAHFHSMGMVPSRKLATVKNRPDGRSEDGDIVV